MPFASCLSLLPAPSDSEAVASPALSPTSAPPAPPSLVCQQLVEECLGWLPLHCTAASPQSSEEATKPPQVARRTCGAPAQLRAPGVVALDPRSVSAHVRGYDVRTCSSPSAQSSPVLVLHRWPRLSSTVPRARLCGLQPPPTAARTRSSAARSPIHARPPSPQDGPLRWRPGMVPTHKEPRQRVAPPDG